MASLEITGGPGRMEALQPGASQTASYTVTNRSAGPINALLRPLPGGVADAGWLTVAGETTRLIEPGETTTVTMRVSVPPGVADGEAEFGLRATNENDANNDWADSPMSSVQVGAAAPVPPPPPPAPTPAIPPSENKVPVWAILGAIVLVLGIGVAWFAMRDDTPQAIPRVDVYLEEAGSNPRAVRLIIQEELGYSRRRAASIVRGRKPGFIVANYPRADAGRLANRIQANGGRVITRPGGSPRLSANSPPAEPSPPTPSPRPTITANPTLAPPIVLPTPLPIPSLSPTPPGVFNHPFAGTWVNANQNTQAATRMIITRSGRNLRVQGYRSCRPSDCPWPVLTVPIRDIDQGVMRMNVNLGSKRLTGQAKLVGGALKTQWIHDFTDPAVQNQITSETFNQQ